MKTIKNIITILFLGLSVSLLAQTKVDTEKSVITWKGYKIAGHHEGTINLKKGSLSFEKGKLTGGNFVVDMTTISSTDVSGKGKERLDGHLKNEDFFDVENHPEAMLVFTKVSEKSKGVYTVTGDLVIKGIKQSVTFDLAVSDHSASTSFEIDRTKFDIKYRSGTIFPELADKAIKDNFDISVKLVF